MKARSRELLDRAIDAMIAAIEIYNKPEFRYRAESFIILATNAWELLSKAKWLADHNNDLRSLYVREGSGSKRKRFKRTASGIPITHGLQYLARKLKESGVLDERAYRNIEILNEYRNISVHLYHRDPKLAEVLQEIATAAVKNFSSAVKDWFNVDLSQYNFYLMPLAFVSPPPLAKGMVLTSAEKKLLKFIDGQRKEDDDPSSPYSVAVNIEVRFVRSKAKDAIPMRITKDPSALEVRLTEDQIRERYPWDYKELTARCRERFQDFKENKKYHQLRKKLESDPRFAYVRRLDPDNPKSSKKTFYNPNILGELEKHYKRKP